MKRKIAQIIFVLLAFVSVALLLTASWSQNEFYAVGRIKIQPNENDLSDPYAFYTPVQTISNFLGSSAVSNELAGISEVSSNFWLVKVDPVRSTRLVRLCYVSYERVGVERIASNACIMVQRFLSTNQPSLEVDYVDTSPDDPPKTWWQRIASRLSNLF
jgi:hypothetical protein